MKMIKVLPERVIEVNKYILSTEAGLKGKHDDHKLHSALGRIDSAIHYEGLNDVFEIASKYAYVHS